MKIDFVLTACNTSDHYLSLYPHIFKVWKEKFNLECYLILIATQIPEFLKEYSDKIILFEPIPNVNSIFIAQVIRILYPCIYENKNILITDVDIFPISHDYFIGSVDKLPDNVFITYRDFYLKKNMFSICYNLANSKTWREIFQIKNVNDIVTTIKEWYDPKYNGTKNCIGWFTDQKKLYEYVTQWNHKTKQLVILNDKNLKFKRLDKRRKIYIITNSTKVVDDI